MRRTLPLLLAAFVLAAPRAASAQESVTANDLVKLAAAGLGDDVLVALIQSHDTVFRLSAADVLSLRDRGLSQKVILAMLETATKPKPTPVDETQPGPAPAPAPVELVPVAPPPPPVVVNVTQQVEQHVQQPREPYSYTHAVPVPVAVPVYVLPSRPVRKPEPVYWGFGGQRRPDTWAEPRDTAAPAGAPRDAAKRAKDK